MDLSFGPLSAVFLVLALALAAGCFVLSGRRARRIDAMSVPSLRDLVRDLRKLPVDERPAELHRRAAPETWEHRLASEVLEAPAGGARVAAANEVLLDLDHEIDVGKTWATAAVRLAIAGTGLLGLGAYLLKGGVIALAGTLLIGFAGSAACFMAGERGKDRASVRREAFDALVSALLPEEAAASRAQQRARRRDRA